MEFPHYAEALKARFDTRLSADKEVMLTNVDIENAYQQCVNQHATSERQLQGMRDALELTKQMAFSVESLTADEVLELIHTLYEKIEPGRGPGWRTTPVTFKNGDRGEHPDNLPHVMAEWADAFAEQRLDPVRAYYYFEKHHPREDGNGRAGHCLWALQTKIMEGYWPETLPPDLFGDQEQPASFEYHSAFGEVESPVYNL